MKRIIYLIIVNLIFTFSLLAQDVTVVTPPSNYIGVKTNSVKTIVEQNAEQLKLANNFVSVFYTKEKNKFIVVKQSRFTYSVTYILIITDGKSIKILDNDYIPKIDDFEIYETEQSLGKITTSNVEFLLDTECNTIPSAVSAINTVAGYATSQGYNVQKLIGSVATASTVKNYISNNDLVAMGNVGHGNPYGIQLRNGDISHSWFATQDLRGEIYYFNSCQVYNEPFVSSMLNSGEARTYIGGKLSLPIGTSEEVFKDFWNYTLNSDWEMDDALAQGEVNNNLQNYHGIGGDVGVLKLTTTGTLNRSEVWLGEVSVSGNVYVPSGKTLTVKTGATISLNGHYIKSTGGSIVQESGSTINGLDAYLKYYSTLKGLYPSVSSAINDAGYQYTVELLPKTYNENISITNKYRRYLKGAPSGTTTINGNITITNSSYTVVSDLTMGDFKTITVNGGYSTNLSNIEYNNTNGATYLNVYNGSSTVIHGLDYIANTASFGWNFYNTNSYNFSYNTIEGYDVAIYSTSNSAVGISESSFCNNLLDLYASSGSSIYGNHITMSYPGAYSGNCTFGAIDGYCGSMAKINNSQIAESEIGTNDNLKDAHAAFIELLADESINKSPTLSEEGKNKIQSVIKKFKDALLDNLSENDKYEALKKLSSCYAMIEDENSFGDYVSNLLSNKQISNEMKRFLIPSLVSKESYNEALNLIDEIITSKDISQDLEYELLYEKGTILKYYLKENEKAEKVFMDLYNNAGKHVLAIFAKAQIEDRSKIDDGNKKINKNNMEVSKDFDISSYPNPFNPSTTIEYQIPKDGFVNLVVYNTLGQIVSTLVNEHQTSGKYSVQFDASNLPSGVYFYKIESGNFTKVNKMLLLR